MSKYKKHHPFCNSWSRPIEESPFCDKYWGEYPIRENENINDKVHEWFTNIIVKNSELNIKG
jgi:hypothetical protein